MFSQFTQMDVTTEKVYACVHRKHRFYLKHGTMLDQNVCYSLLTEKIRLYGVKEHGHTVLSFQVLLNQVAQVHGEDGLHQIHTPLSHVEEEKVVRRFRVLARQFVTALLRTVHPPAKQLVARLAVLLRRCLERFLQARYFYLVRLFQLRYFCIRQIT